MAVSQKQISKYYGKKIYAVKKDGSIVTGTVTQIQGNRVILTQVTQEKGKTVKSKFLIPLLLFDLLAIGLFSGFGGFGGFGGFDGDFFF
ncbi:50S ribosomal protein L33 [Paenibacillus montanisoli]|uniref:50S ribosomal protein L33 n=1 Tax=Paenibacillus montanisoli TaxID=2081970 RepID=A0A328UAG9_9BACL|nr:50S ribosomal protein L33 [Paenibacillus montanisoli]RAP77254.1 50S ribosomal protein L33 [Paenibacillus montanisoli]